MRIPDFVETQVVDEEGFLTPTWKHIFSVLITQLQLNFSDEGYVLPQQTTTNITKLDNIESIGRIIYDKDTNKMKVNINGTYKIVQTA